MLPVSFRELILEDDEIPCQYDKRGVGRGHAASGSRARWKKKQFFEQDLLRVYSSQLTARAFKSTYVFEPQQIARLFVDIKAKLLRPKETEVHARNKILLWLDKLHGSLSGQQMSVKYYIGVQTAYSHISDVLKAVLMTFNKAQLVQFPSATERDWMVKILKQKNAPMPDALFAVDGSHARCSGYRFRERLSYKWKNRPCFNAMFIIERVFGTICAFNLDPSAAKHDIKILKQSWFYPVIDQMTDGWIILADKGYVGVQKDVDCIAMVLKKNMKERDMYSKSYWYNFNVARGQVESTFADFFHNKFRQLSQWPGKSAETFVDWAANVICCVLLFNKMKKLNAHQVQC